MCRMRDVDSPALTLGYEVPILTFNLILILDALFVLSCAIASVQFSVDGCDQMLQVP